MFLKSNCKSILFYKKNSQTIILGFGNLKIEEKSQKKIKIQNLPPKFFFFVKISFFPETLYIFHHLRSITYSKKFLSKFDFLAKNLNR